MSPDTMLCPHFGCCGGCSRQHLAYSDQLRRKADLLQDLFCSCHDSPIDLIPSPVVWHYRNKIDPSFAPKHYPEPPPAGFVRETVLGFKQSGRWFHPMEMDACMIGPEGLPPLLQQLRRWYQSGPLSAYDSRKGTGVLRSLLVRDAKRSGERMLALITTPEPAVDLRPFVDIALNAFAPTGICHGEYAGKADVATAERLTVLHGKETIREILKVPKSLSAMGPCHAWPTPGEYTAQKHRDSLCLEFRISPLSFFQTNPMAAERLYARIRHWVAQIRPALLLDLYGGSGGIALSCADLVPEVISVESCPEATEDGRHNARANRISNVVWTTDTVQDFLKQQLEGKDIPAHTAVIVDPPRAGMHPKAISRLMLLKPKHLLYVSCNPKRLKTELPLFLQQYHLTDIIGVDMFPHTEHVEILAALEGR